jgi:hypothetical protein
MTTALSQWKKAGIHDVTLASGFKVKIKLPNLPELVRSGEFPNHLVDTAIKVASTPAEDQKITPEDVKAQAEFYCALVSFALVEPAVTPEDVKELPFEDIELLAALATRQRDLDALGHQIAGLDKNEDWRKFRGIDYLD